MKSRGTYCSALLITLIVIWVIPVSAQEQGKQEMTPEQKAWMEFMTPGWPHEKLAKSAGKWNTSTKFWHAPGTEPEISTGSFEAEMILGGRYLATKFNGTSMGHPMEGFSLEAYDNAKKEFVSVWIDNMGTGIAVSYGKITDDKKKIEYTGTMTDPMTKADSTFRSVMTFVNDDKTVFEIFGNVKGKEIKMMEMVSTRAK